MKIQSLRADIIDDDEAHRVFVPFSFFNEEQKKHCYQVNMPAKTRQP